jgi:vacuolar-type H+-ATPase subunit F/Vma7
MKKLAFIGPGEYVDLFRLIGFECFESLNQEETLSLIERLEDYPLIIVSQDVCPEKIISEKVVVLPGLVKKQDENYLKNEIKKAVGGDIMLI